ncbi:hypothetical protein P153DRAFT_370056 [Dothidotthia symphoricarpi CBS 119687]|uniref:SH3 domain-containing protein n=1 Tax=Dothidotthia symphoricarpi CBS 119687 TaxID=1392245 RepID=A0A6A6A3S1_9PLEO|nr:uncharacterized protein P153DRAFT_370056 [Dothidotthia symphoricarpi CBS 119687]KAF2125388.1 hypothetical protein P153DRAFT_370056 [Dothidotthia symphoricarpi CBS 119687]
MAAGQALPTRFPCWCKAVYSWGGETKRDLGFIEGDLIEVLNAGDGAWWMGRLKRDRRMVGLFPSNFVELLSENFQPWNTMAAAGNVSRQNSAVEPVKQTPQKAKSTFRKPFTAYAGASAPNPAAAARERLKAGGSASPHGAGKKTPYSSMKHQSSVDSRDSHSPAPSRGNSHLHVVPPRPTTKRPATSPAPPPGRNYHTRTRSDMPQSRSQHLGRAVSPAPPSRYATQSSYTRARSPAPPTQQQYQPEPDQYRAYSPIPPSRHGSHTSYASYNRAPSPAPPPQPQEQYRAYSPLPPSRHGSHASYASYNRAPSPAPPPSHQYHSRAVSPAPPPTHYEDQFRAVSPAPPSNYDLYSRALSPAPPIQRTHSRAVSPAPSFQHAHSRAVSPAPSFQEDPRAVSPAPSQYRAYDKGPSPSPYQRSLYSRSPSPEIELEEAADSPPPPPPPPHRVVYNTSRGPSPAPPPHTPEPPSPDPRARRGHFTPSPLTSAMNDVMSSLQDMASPDEAPPASNPWSPDAFDQVHQASANLSRAQKAGSRIGSAEEDDDAAQDSADGPPDADNYVKRMESRLRRMHQLEKSKADDLHMPPPVPQKDSAQRPGSSRAEPETYVERKGSRLIHRKSTYDVGRNALGRTFTSKTSSTTTTDTSASTNRSLMSGHSATNMSATSAGSYYRKKFGANRPKTMMETTTGKGYGFDDGRPETPFTGVTYHSSHDSHSGSSHQEQPVEYDTPKTAPATDGPDPLGGLTQPKPKRSGFFRKMIDTAKTQAANARTTIATNRPGSRAASRAVSRAAGRAASRLDNTSPTGTAGGSSVPPSTSTKETGLGSVDWVQVRRDVNRSNSLSRNERAERLERCQMMDLPVFNPIDILYESAEGDEGLDGLPIAEPTNFAACALTHVDKATRFINNVPLGTSPAAFAQGYICRPYRSDVQRLRAIFTWVSERISWEEDFEGEMDTRHVMQSKRGCSQEIAMVVAEMCASVGLHAEVVRGYLKTPGEVLDLESIARPNHFWNAVIVDGEWRLMDCSLSGPTHPKRVHYSTTGSQVAESWYFLARPLEICFSHVPLLPEQQHICPPQPHDILVALPCATPAYFRHGLQIAEFDTSLLNLDNLEMAHIYVNVPEDVECVAEIEARTISQDADGDYFESGELVRKPALAQPEWHGGQKRYTVKGLVPGDEGHGVLKIYAGPRGLMHSNKLNPHALAVSLPLTHTGSNPPHSFLTLHPTPHAQRHDLYVAQPQCANLALNNTFVFCVRQHPSSLTQSPETSAAIGGRASPNPFARPTSAMSMQSISATGSNYTNPSQSSAGSAGSGGMKPAKLAIQTPSGKIIRLTRKMEHISSTSDADGTAWETVIKIGERGTWRGLVLADRSARWCVFAQWDCA